MSGRAGPPRDTSLRTYGRKRDFAVTAEPAPEFASPAPNARDAPIFVVQKHAAHRAGLHWDFRLEHGGVLWSWAVRKGPSLDPAVKRIAAHVEDHPLEYADFQGTIPDGQYGAGTVETWDRGIWEPIGDPEVGMQKGELTFTLHGTRLNGRFHLVRLKPKERQRGDPWLLFKGHDASERAGADALAIEAAIPPPASSRRNRATRDPPAPGAKRDDLPDQQSPQLSAPFVKPPEGEDWLTEIKFDGYRLLVWLDHGKVRILTRNGLDWTDRLPSLAQSASRLNAQTALLDGELVALRNDGRTSFPELQAALSAGQDGRLFFYAFDLLYLDGWDLRACQLADRKRVLAGLDPWNGMLRYSDHQRGEAEAMLRASCRMGLEGIICKRADAPYRAGRGHGWVKVKCQGREEFVVLGWTPPRGMRTGLGALHVGYYDPQGGLHYAGGVGTGFSDDELARLRKRLDAIAAAPPEGLLVAGDPLEKSIHWVRPELVIEVQFINWSGSGRVRHAVYVGLREDKEAKDVVQHDIPDPEAQRVAVAAKPASGDAASVRSRPKIAVPPRRASPVIAGSVVTASAPKHRTATVGAVKLTHPDRELWPGITKLDLAAYWRAVAEHALPELARRPLAIVRCPEGIGGEHFFQKRAHGSLPSQIRDGEAAGSPYLAIDDLDGLIALVQMSAIELHAWGSTEVDALHPDRLVFDLDPGDDVPFSAVVQAARDTRDRLKRIGLESFCRTTGGKGLHVVVPIKPEGDWDEVKAFCHAFAETMSQEEPERFLPTLRKVDRKGRILVDWLRNGLGATAVCSFCPRARPGATIATPLAWAEVTARLDPASFTVQSVPARLARQRREPWEGFAAASEQSIPDIPTVTVPRQAHARGEKTHGGRKAIVFAPKPKPRAPRQGSA